MQVEQRILEQFEALELEAPKVIAEHGARPYSTDFWLIGYAKWMALSRNLIEKVCGPASVHYQHAVEASGGSFISRLHHHFGILQAAHLDYKNGMLANLRHVIHVQVSDDFLTQAEALFSQGYYVPAASLAGAILEDTLRALCDKHSVPYNANKSSLEALNVELGKAGVYDRLIQKRITAESDLRNNADHGHFDKVKQADVEEMLRWIRRFISEWLP
jgi:uncharacterized protein (UPF0332 family)